MLGYHLLCAERIVGMKMTDTERLNLIEHYGWKIYQAVNKSWQVGGPFGVVRRNNLREAIDEALSRQAKWALS